MTEADKKRIKPHLSKMAHYCSRQERAISEVLLKLRNAPLSQEDNSYIIAFLQKEGFLNETRYACAFCNDKFKLNHWGRIKINYALKMKQVSHDAIAEGMQQIDDESYLNLIETLAKKKATDTNSNHLADRNNKIARFLLQRGFEPDLVWKAINSLP